LLNVIRYWWKRKQEQDANMALILTVRIECSTRRGLGG